MQILIVASVPFRSLRRRPQQLALGLAALGHEILYLNPPRAVRSLVDPGRFEPGGEVSSTPESDAELRQWAPAANLKVIEGSAPSAGSGEWTTREGWAHWGEEVRRIVAALPEPAEVALVDHPAMIQPVRESHAAPLVFDCREDYPSLARSRSIQEAYDEALTRGLPQVDGMLAVNRYLLESWGRLLAGDIPQAVVEHGVDLQLFRPPDPQRTAAMRSALEIAPGQRMICCLGRMDARFSYEDLETLLALDEKAILLFVGEVSPDGRTTFQRLPSQRILPLGPVPPEKAAEIVAASDALFFPFRREPHLESHRGLKLYEYLATGRPIVATFRRTLKAYREVLYLYSTREELEDAYRAAMGEGEDAPVRAERIRIARSATWTQRADQVAEFLEGLLEDA